MTESALINLFLALGAVSVLVGIAAEKLLNKVVPQ